MKITKEKLLRVIILLIGLTIAHLGVTLFLQADMGADPFNVFVQGIFRSIGKVWTGDWLTHGRVHIVISLIIIVVLLIVDRSYVKIGTVLCMVCGGPIIDFFNWILTPLFELITAMWSRVLINALGCCILAFGMTIVIKSEAGTGPNDLASVVISDKLHKKFSIVRIIVDVFFAGVGFALGGTIGIGTAICAFLVGPVAGFFLPVNEKWINRVCGKFGRN